MKTVHLHGILKEKFGGPFKFDIENPKQAISALYHQLADFGNIIRDGEWHLIIGKQDSGISIDENEITFCFGKQQEFHLIPAVRGAKQNSGILKVVVGVALIGIAIAGAALTGGFGAAAFGLTSHLTWGTLAATGLAVTFAGVSSMLSPVPNIGNYQQRQPVDQRPSFLFNGATNQSEQGAPIPIVYGQIRVGSVVASTGLATEQV